jgi:hypothetical protein
MNPQIEGMTLRDYFAAQALPACMNWIQLHAKHCLIADGEPKHSYPVLTSDAEDTDCFIAAEAAYFYADAMMKYRSNE